MPKAAAAARKRRKEILQTSRVAGGASDMQQVELPPEMNAAAEAAAAAAAVAAVAAVGAESPSVKKRQRKSSAKAAAAAAAADGDSDGDDDDDQDDYDDQDATAQGDAVAVPAANAKRQTKCTKTGKTMNTYEPDVDMTKEQLTAWRREARRVRNRESAAASRMKTKNRISELEDEVNAYKSKYEAAMQKLAEYEAEAL
mmetsp:Transcript_15726/g.45330  ORF Transcript_15726/g.45330 Transcript_15726/m.45330 type:complete len:199 (-) Transcript_15726:288-884(-)